MNAFPFEHPDRLKTDHPAYENLDDDNPAYYPVFSTVVAQDKQPEGDRFAFATWSQEMSSGQYYHFYPRSYGGTDAPIATPQDAGLIGRNIVNPRF